MIAADVVFVLDEKPHPRFKVGFDAGPLVLLRAHVLLYCCAAVCQPQIMWWGSACSLGRHRLWVRDVNVSLSTSSVHKPCIVRCFLTKAQMPAATRTTHPPTFPKRNTNSTHSAASAAVSVDASCFMHTNTPLTIHTYAMCAHGPRSVTATTW